MCNRGLHQAARWALGVALALAQTDVGQAQAPATATASTTATNNAIVFRVQGSAEKLELTIHSSRILTLDLKIPRAQVNNPDLLDITPIAANQLQIYAKKAGVTQVNLWDENGDIHAIDVVIYGDVRELTMTLASQFPTAAIKVFPTSTSVILSGTVDRPDQISKIMNVAQDYYPKIINNITVGGAQQVLLHVKVMEISRTRLRTLGIDWAQFSSSDFVTSTVGGIITKASSTSAINGGSSALTTTGNQTMQFGLLNANASFFAFIQALQQNNLVKLVAEPTLVAVSGRPAYFTDGGKVPYPVVSGIGSVNISFASYGTTVDFVPIVLGDGRIRLEVRPSISEIDYSVATTLNGTTVPGFTERTVDTGVELQAGQTLALAGLIQQRIESSKRVIPVLGDLPLIGAAFRFTTDTDNEVELLVLVRPEFASAMDCEEVPPLGPGENSEIPNAIDFYINGYSEVAPYHGRNQQGGAPTGPQGAMQPAFGDNPNRPGASGNGFEVIPPGQPVNNLPPGTPGQAVPSLQTLPPGQSVSPSTGAPPGSSTTQRRGVNTSTVRVAQNPGSAVNPTRDGTAGRGTYNPPTSAPAGSYKPPQQKSRQAGPGNSYGEPPGFIGPTGYDVVN
jgi:pilus assembly protein CpaC